MERGAETENGESTREFKSYWKERFDLIDSEYGYISDEEILKLPYFRFCQILEAIHARKYKERKFYVMVQEVGIKFIASVIASTTPLTSIGISTLSQMIDEFSIFKREESRKKELPVGGYEAAMNIFKSIGGTG